MSLNLENPDTMSIINTMKIGNGLELNRFKIKFIERRFKARMNELKISNVMDYIHLVKKDPNESSMLMKSLSINVTKFYRDKHVFETFSSKVIPEIQKMKNGESVKIWSAACASGEEPYSLAIMFNEALQNKNLDFKIQATDISSKAVEFAKKGTYTSQQLVNISPHLIPKYFIFDGEEYTVKDELKKKVVFNVGDVVSSSQKYLDVIFCRNVLIYYAKDAQDLFFKKFYHALNTNGHLVLGMDENIMGQKSPTLFTPINIRERIYKKNLTV